MDTKEIDVIVEKLAPALEKSIEEKVEASSKKANEEKEALFKELQEDVASIKASSKQVSEGTEAKAKEGRQKAGKLFRSMLSGDTASMKTMSEGTDADGGYLVHPEFHTEVIRVMEETGFARNFCRVLPMGSSSKNISALASSVTAYIVDEGGQITASTPWLWQKVLNARKFAVLVEAFQELIDDNTTDEEVMTLVASLSAEALAQLEDKQVLTGSGTGSNMLGVFADTNVNIVSLPATKTSFEDVDYKSLVKLKNAVAMKYKKQNQDKLCFAGSQDVFTALESMVDGEGRPLLRESLVVADSYTLLGYPFEIVDGTNGTAEDGANVKFLAFGNFSFFILGDRKQIASEIGYTSGGFERDRKAIKITERVAGVNVLPDAFAVLKTATS